MTALPSKPTWATIVTLPPPPKLPAPAPTAPVIEDAIDVTDSWWPGLPTIPAGSILTVHLENTVGWIEGKIEEHYPRTLRPQQLWAMFPHLRKHLFAHHDVDYDWLEPGGMYCFFVRPGITRKTYHCDGSTYIIDFTRLAVGHAEHCPACNGPIIKKYHRGFG